MKTFIRNVSALSSLKFISLQFYTIRFKSIAIFAIFAIASSCDGVIINCDFKLLSNVSYECYTATIISLEDPSQVTNITGNRLPGKEDSDVGVFGMRNEKNLEEIPRGIENFFPNLGFFIWMNSNLATVSAEILKYPKLRKLNLSGNKLQSLDGNLLQNSIRLQTIYFHGNLIQNVGHGFIDQHLELTVAWFSANKCIQFNAGTSTEVTMLRSLLRSYCPPLTTDPPTTTVSTQIPTGECPEDCLERFEKMELRIQELEGKIGE